MYLIDIVIPCYYASKIIQPCFEKLAAQTYRGFRVAMINDCSPYTDDEYKDIRELYKDKMNLEYYKMEKNSGPGAVRQRGLDMATGDFIMFIDDDDELYSERSLQDLIDATRGENLEDVMIITSHSMQKYSDDTSHIIQPGFHHHGSLYNVKLLKKHNIHYEPELSYKEEDCVFAALVDFYLRENGYREIHSPRTTYIKKWFNDHDSLTKISTPLESLISFITAKRIDLSYQTHISKTQPNDACLMVPIIFSRILGYLQEGKEFLNKKQYDLICRDINEYQGILNKFNINLSKVEILQTIRSFFNEFFNGENFYGKWNENDIYFFPLTYEYNLSCLAQYIKD